MREREREFCGEREVRGRTREGEGFYAGRKVDCLSRWRVLQRSGEEEGKRK